MKRENKRVLLSLMLAICVVISTGFSSKAESTLSEALPVDNIETQNTKEEFTSPLAEAINNIPKVAAIAVATQEWYGKAVANADIEINVQTERRDDSAIVGVMYSNTIVDVEEKDAMWSKITSGQVSGYVKNEFLAFGEEAVKRANSVCPSVAVANSAEAEIKATPNQNSQSKGYAKTEVNYPVLEDTGNWVKVQDEEKTEVYIAKDLVTISRNAKEAKTLEQLAAEEAARVAAEKEAARVAAEQEAARVAAEQQAAEAAEAASVQYQAMSSSYDEQAMLAALIHCEAGGEPYEGQVAVGAVVLNRVRSGIFPNSISEVIYQSGQFGPAITGLLDQVMASGATYASCYQAAADALAGANPIGDALYFGNGDYGQLIGGHWFH